MTDDLIEIRIPLIVTADGQWMAWGGDADEGPGWDRIESCWLNQPLINPARMWVTVYVPKPKTIEVNGSVSEAQ